MRYFIFLFILAAFACTTEEPDSKLSSVEIKEMLANQLDDWHKAAAEANFEPYFNLFSDDGIYIGTDSSEIWTVDEFKSFSKPYFDKGKAWSFKATDRDRNLYLSKTSDVVWFDEILDTWMGTCRGSGVFQKYQGEWKLEHYVLSLAIPNEKMDSIITIIR